jgi:FKBP-type peptidyl-prolyl cis-trans isomerase FklB
MPTYRRVASAATGLVLLYGASIAPAAALPPAPTTALEQLTAPPTAKVPPAVSAEIGSYDIGLMLGNQLTNNGLGTGISRAALLRGLEEALGGKPVSADQKNAAQQFIRAARNALAERNQKLAREFLEKNAQKKGVKTLASGLQYRVLAEGDPQRPSPGPVDQVSVRYRASLPDGTELDRSEDHAQAAVFRMNSMIPAWHEALSAMRPGAKWQVFVPPELGYGVNAPPPLPPGSLIVYELELLRVEASGQVPPQFMKPPAGPPGPTAKNPAATP